MNAGIGVVTFITMYFKQEQLIEKVAAMEQKQQKFEETIIKILLK